MEPFLEKKKHLYFTFVLRQKLKSGRLSDNFFFFKQDKTRKKADDSRVYCKLCEGKRKQAGIPYNKSTTSLKSHMQNNHGEEFKLAEDSDTKKKEVKPITAFFMKILVLSGRRTVRSGKI